MSRRQTLLNTIPKLLRTLGDTDLEKVGQFVVALSAGYLNEATHALGVLEAGIEESQGPQVGNFSSKPYSGNPFQE